MIKDEDIPKDIPYIINSRFCKLFFDMLNNLTTNTPLSENKKVFLDISSVLSKGQEPESNWKIISNSILKNHPGDDPDISSLAYKYCHQKANSYFYKFYKIGGSVKSAQLLLIQFIRQIKLKYLKKFENAFGVKTNYLDKLRKQTMFKKKTIKEDQSLPANLRGLPTFLTNTDQKEYLNQLIEEAKTKKFNLLTNLYFENNDANFDIKDKVKIFEGKYMRTYLINKQDIGKYKTYNTDPNSAEFQQLIEDSAKSTDYFKIENFFVNGRKTIELEHQVKIKKEMIEKQRKIEILNFQNKLKKLKELEQKYGHSGETDYILTDQALNDIENIEDQCYEDSVGTLETVVNKSPTLSPSNSTTPLDFIKQSHTMKMSFIKRNKLFLKTFRNIKKPLNDGNTRDYCNTMNIRHEEHKQKNNSKTSPISKNGLILKKKHNYSLAWDTKGKEMKILNDLNDLNLNSNRNQIDKLDLISEKPSNSKKIKFSNRNSISNINTIQLPFTTPKLQKDNKGIEIKQNKDINDFKEPESKNYKIKRFQSEIINKNNYDQLYLQTDNTNNTYNKIKTNSNNFRTPSHGSGFARQSTATNSLARIKESTSILQSIKDNKATKNLSDLNNKYGIKIKKKSYKLIKNKTNSYIQEHMGINDKDFYINKKDVKYQ